MSLKPENGHMGSKAMMKDDSLSNPRTAQAMLPQKQPFAFIDRIMHYEPKQYLKAEFVNPDFMGEGDRRKELPITILVEGMAQAAVLLTQLETSPLQDSEIPLLGKLEVTVFKEFKRGGRLYYSVKPIKMLSKQAVIAGEAFDHNEDLLFTATIILVVANRSEMKS